MIEERIVNDRRRMWKLLVFGFLTFGIYDIYMYWTMINDLNTACGYAFQDDSRLDDRSHHYLIVVLLTFVTFGIYAFVWQYKQGNRLRATAKRYNFEINETGGTYLLWDFFGSLLLGLGPFIAQYLFINNANKVCYAYNKAIEGKMTNYGVEQQKRVSTPPQGNVEASTVSLGMNRDEGTFGVDAPTQSAKSIGTLKCIKGSLNGAAIDIKNGESMLIGRSSSMCNLILPEADISRKHCEVKYKLTSMECYFEVTDFSTYGTVINGSQPLQKGVPTRCPVGARLTLGKGSNEFILQ